VPEIRSHDLAHLRAPIGEIDAASPAIAARRASSVSTPS